MKKLIALVATVLTLGIGGAITVPALQNAQQQDSFVCAIEGCPRTSEHQHIACPDEVCQLTYAHAHGGVYYLGRPPVEQAADPAATELYVCPVAGCVCAGTHSHLQCPYTDCAQVTDHAHNGMMYYSNPASGTRGCSYCGQNYCAQDCPYGGQGACGVSGCTQTGSHGHGGGHHGGGHHH